MIGQTSLISWLRWVMVLLLSLVWTTMGSAAALAERGDFGRSSFAANSAPRVRLNVFGEGEARGFLDVSTNTAFANGRPLTSGLASGSADDIFIRSSPLGGENTISEIMRLSKPGTRITIVNGSQNQANLLRNAFGAGAETVLERTFQSNTISPGQEMSIMKLLVK